MKKEDKIRLLLISFHFAPSAAVGAKRFIFLSNFFQKDIGNLYILTIKKNIPLLKDCSLSFSGKVYSTSMFPYFPPAPTKSILKRVWLRLWKQFLCVLDPFSGWIIPSFFKGLHIIKKHRIDTILVTGPPFSQVLTALLLSRIFRLKLIIDYQDPWTTNLWDTKAKYGNFIFEKINFYFERLAVKFADDIVVCSQKMKERFEKCLGNSTTADCHVIYNGYTNVDNVVAKSLPSNRKNLVYAGDLYGERKISLVTEPLLSLVAEGLLEREKCCLHIFGRLNFEDVHHIKKNSLEDIIIVHTPVPFTEIIGYLKAADILILIAGKVMDYSISYKFYDYLSVRRPILAIVPKNSEMSSLFEKVECGEVGFVDSRVSIRNSLKKLLLCDRHYSFEGAQNYTWQKAAEKYLKVLIP